MKVKDLPDPVVGWKNDFSPAADEGWLGFTPANDTLVSRNKCETQVNAIAQTGFILEYVTQGLPEVNVGYEGDETYLTAKAEHDRFAGRLIALHRIRHVAQLLETVIGNEAYERLQNVWALGGKRWRWSVAFPIVESYRIVSQPIAKDVLGSAAYNRLAKPTSILNRLDDDARAAIAELEIEHVPALHIWSAIDADAAIAERDRELDQRKFEAAERLMRSDYHDHGALEGKTTEARRKLIARSTRLSRQFKDGRQQAGTLHCDHCAFNPAGLDWLAPRLRASALDAHHRCPLEEGERLTTTSDFDLLCPTCHRVEHLRLRLAK